MLRPRVIFKDQNHCAWVQTPNGIKKPRHRSMRRRDSAITVPLMMLHGRSKVAFESFTCPYANFWRMSGDNQDKWGYDINFKISLYHIHLCTKSVKQVPFDFSLPHLKVNTRLNMTYQHEYCCFSFIFSHTLAELSDNRSQPPSHVLGLGTFATQGLV